MKHVYALFVIFSIGTVVPQISLAIENIIINGLFKDKVVVITGAASGIGQETARMLKKEGAKIIAVDRNCPNEAYDEYIHIDLQCPDSINQALAKIPQGIDALCNIAGVPPTAGAELVLKVNVLGLIKLTEGLIDKLNDKGIINKVKVGNTRLMLIDWKAMTDCVDGMVRNGDTFFDSPKV